MRIIGIDPGTSSIGYGLIDFQKSKYYPLAFGTLALAKTTSQKERLALVYEFFEKLTKKYRPQKIVLEQLFFFKNKKTAIAVSETRGVLILLANKLNLELVEFTPLEVKQAVSSHGRADKIQVKKMVKIILNLKSEPKSDDAADALALAICCANTINYDQLKVGLE